MNVNIARSEFDFMIHPQPMDRGNEMASYYDGNHRTPLYSDILVFDLCPQKYPPEIFLIRYTGIEVGLKHESY